MPRILRAVVMGLFVSLAVAPGVPIGAQPADAGLRLVRTRSSLLGSHDYYQQTYRDVDVLGGSLTRHLFDAGDVVTRDRRRTVGRDISVIPTIPALVAGSQAGPFVVRSDLAIQPGPEPRLVWAVLSEPPTGTVRTLVDAQTGAVIFVERIARDVDGTGRVFNPNPVVTLRDQTLRDQRDADYPALAGAYRIVPLTHLDGSGFLRGEFARIGFDNAHTAFSTSNTFMYDRSSTFFSQTMAYYHVTAAQEYLQSLGFIQVNNEPQDLFPDAFPADNSFYSPATDSIHFGTGGVDDAEDADVILHEYGHSIQDDQVPGFGASLDAGSIGEGFSDYWAVTMSQPVNDNYEVPCMADWDSVEVTPEPHCLTRVDLDLTIDDRNFEVHHDGQIWSRALWDINQALGRDVANVIVIEAQFAYSPATTFDEAARTTVDTARRLFGNRAAKVVHDAFERRGLIVRPNVAHRSAHPPQGPPGLLEIARLGEAAPNDGAYEFDFEPYGLDDRGTALYAADVSTGGEGIFLAGRIASAIEIVRSGNPAPGGGILGFGVQPSPSLSEPGNVAMSFFLAPFLRPAGRNSGVYRWSKSGTQAVVVPGVTSAPTGGTFVGSSELAAINNAGAVAFSGMISTTQGISGTLGIGVFVASPAGSISTVAAPGTPAPGGGTFDFATEPAMNNAGDIVFTGHVAGTPCLATIPQTRLIGCVRDLFVKRAATGTVERIAGVGRAAPGGGVFRDIRYPVMNERGDILFRAALLTDAGLETGYFLSRDGEILTIARVGDPMPGGGSFVGVSFQPGNWDLNERGDVAFSAQLDTFDNVLGEFGLADQGLYTWRNGVVTLVIRSGGGVPGGEVVALEPPEFLGNSAPFSGAQINNSGQVLFQAAVLGENGSFDGILYVQQ